MSKRFILLATIYVAHHGTSFAEIGTVSVKNLNGRIPEVDAMEALNSGNTNYLGIAGYSVTVPGIDEGHCKVHPAFVDIIPGTGDYVGNPNASASYKLQVEYALRYNFYVKTHSKKTAPMECFIPAKTTMQAIDVQKEIGMIKEK